MQDSEQSPQSSQSGSNILIGVKALFLLALLVFLCANVGLLRQFLERVTTDSTDVALFGFFSVKLETIQTKPDSTSNDLDEWAVSHRIHGPLQVWCAAFDDQQLGFEYLEVIALKDVDLTDGYIGDSDEMVKCAPGDLRLRKGDKLRIYTLRGDHKPSSGDVRWTDTDRLSGKPTKGIFKANKGRGDRIVILSKRGVPLLDMDYWWLAGEVGNLSTRK